MDDIYADGEYLSKNPHWHIEDSAWKAKKIMSILQRNGVAPKTIVEIGCGVGEILTEMHRAMPETTEFVGYEISPHAFELSRERETDRLTFNLSDFLQEENINFDCALTIDVVEHVEDYIGFLKKLRPKSEYHVFHIPLEMSAAGVMRDWVIQSREAFGHIHYFSEATVLAALTDAGYDIVDSAITCGDDEQPKMSGTSVSIVRLIRRAVGFFSLNFAARSIGGYSLLVLAKNMEESDK